MKQKGKSYIFVFLIILVMTGASFAQGAPSETLASLDQLGERMIEGQVLYAPYYSTTTYLIDNTGAINHTWPSAYQPFAEAYWLGNGTILRPISLTSGGGIQKILWDGTLAWDYRYTVSGCTCHHDIKYLPNGNVLMIVWETKTRTQAIDAGRNPSSLPGTTFYPDKIIEVNQTGPTSGDVVWEWNVWDHLIQDFDPSKENYGVVGDHPELININFADTFYLDWLHTNSLDYNTTFDQILIDVHNFNEIWVIDHNTTTEEAAGHTGGHYGHGGDLLYRWGNPQAYDRGNTSDQTLFGQHDATWIPSGYPGAGHILIFNNGYNRPDGLYSSVDEFAPPINATTGEYSLENESAYGPNDLSWEYTANPPTSFYSNVFGGALRLMDGNTLICGGTTGKIFEVTSDGTTVWEYTNLYPNPTHNWVFKIDYIPPAEPEQQSPLFGTPNPTNGSINNPLSFSWDIPISDPEGDLFSWTIQCSNGQSTNETDASNGTKSLNLSNLSFESTYTVWVNATDPAGSGQYTRGWYTFTTGGVNQPPFLGLPTPANGSIDQPLGLVWSISINDPNGDQFSWTIQCSNGQTSSGTGATNETKTLLLPGLTSVTTYKIWVNATDSNGSGLYTRRWYTFTTGTNQPPDTPTITGPTKGKIKVATEYNFTASDPNDDEVYFFIDWGDGTNSSWIGPYASGDVINQSHTWSKKGTYLIKAKAKDAAGAESDWGNFSVKMPYKPSQFRLIVWFLERFPNAFPILRLLLG